MIRLAYISLHITKGSRLMPQLSFCVEYSLEDNTTMKAVFRFLEFDFKFLDKTERPIF